MIYLNIDQYPNRFTSSQVFPTLETRWVGIGVIKADQVFIKTTIYQYVDRYFTFAFPIGQPFIKVEN